MGQPSTLLGYPVAIDDNMPNVGAGEYAIAFGNFSRAYTIVNRTGTSLIRDNITSKGITKLNFRRRFAGASRITRR
jgi:HK97 family phage major capsid protein